MFDSTMNQGAKSATENMEGPGRQRAAQEGIGRDLEIHIFGGREWVGTNGEKFSCWVSGLKESQLAISWPL